MKFVWEYILIGDHETTTKRAKVIGGWIVRTESVMVHHLGQQNSSRSEALVFVPDPNHEWAIEE